MDKSRPLNTQDYPQRHDMKSREEKNATRIPYVLVLSLFGIFLTPESREKRGLCLGPKQFRTKLCPGTLPPKTAEVSSYGDSPGSRNRHRLFVCWELPVNDKR